MRTGVLTGLLAALVVGAAFSLGSTDKGNRLNGTRIEGVLVGDNIWNLNGSPYWVESDIQIPKGSSLTIGAGVSVFVNGDYYIYVVGNLSINGNRLAPVSFSPNGSAQTWKYISVYTGHLSSEWLRISQATVVLANVTDALLEHVVIDGPGNWTTMQFQNVLNLSVNNLTITRSGTGNAIGGWNASRFTLRDFDISGPGSGGVMLYHCNMCSVTNGYVRSMSAGTSGMDFNGDDSSISGVRIDGTYQAITFLGNRTRIESNTLESPRGFGILVEGSDNVIEDNLVRSPAVSGIDLSATWYLTTRNIVTGNAVTGSPLNGIHFTFLNINPTLGDQNTAAFNTVESSGTGICLESSHHTVYGNILTGNGVGMSATGSSNRIYHNHFNYNFRQALDPGTGNAWDDGYPSGGNWWSDYTGVDFFHGPLQNLPGSDGIGDTSYVIDPDSKDNYPFYYMPLPPPPRHVTASTSGMSGNVVLQWEKPPLFANGRYLIYTAPVPTGFDFKTPNATVNAPATTWVDFGAAWQSGPKYYVVRALNTTSGATSPTSNTAGKWTASFQPGLHTFSLPLERYPWIDYSQPGWADTAGEFVSGMMATSVEYMESGGWLSVPGQGDRDRQLKMGEGYLVNLSGPVSYTFVGLPASMISYEDSPPLWYAGFGQDHAREIWATPFGDDVLISWVQPPGMMSIRDSYKVYCSPTRDGFFGVEGHDYFLLNGAPVPAPFQPIANAYHAGALATSRQWYYMVVPRMNSSREGSSSYSIGVFEVDLGVGYSAIGMPLSPYVNGTFMRYNVSALSSPEILGVQWLDPLRNDWVAHAGWMPAGMYDTDFTMVMAVQVSTSAPTGIAFTGV